MHEKQKSFTFDEIDFQNYPEIKAYFIERCAAFGVEHAPFEN
jgi:hypothetical protein